MQEISEEEELKLSMPYFYCLFCRVWEKMMEKLLGIGARVTGVKRKIANWAKGVGLQGNQNIEQGYAVN